MRIQFEKSKAEWEWLCGCIMRIAKGDFSGISEIYRYLFAIIKEDFEVIKKDFETTIKK